MPQPRVFLNLGEFKEREEGMVYILHSDILSDIYLAFYLALLPVIYLTYIDINSGILYGNLLGILPRFLSF